MRGQSYPGLVAEIVDERRAFGVIPCPVLLALARPRDALRGHGRSVSQRCNSNFSASRCSRSRAAPPQRRHRRRRSRRRRPWRRLTSPRRCRPTRRRRARPRRRRPAYRPRPTAAATCSIISGRRRTPRATSRPTPPTPPRSRRPARQRRAHPWRRARFRRRSADPSPTSPRTWSNTTATSPTAATYSLPPLDSRRRLDARSAQLLLEPAAEGGVAIHVDAEFSALSIKFSATLENYTSALSHGEFVQGASGISWFSTESQPSGTFAIAYFPDGWAEIVEVVVGDADGVAYDVAIVVAPTSAPSPAPTFRSRHALQLVGISRASFGRAEREAFHDAVERCVEDVSVNVTAVRDGEARRRALTEDSAVTLAFDVVSARPVDDVNAALEDAVASGLHHRHAPRRHVRCDLLSGPRL